MSVYIICQIKLKFKINQTQSNSVKINKKISL